MNQSVVRRKTRQSALISDYLDEQVAFMSAQDVHAGLRDRGESVGLATVYRVLQRLVDDGTVDQVVSMGGEAVYRKCGGGTHHHHLVCRGCGAAEEIRSDSIERILTNAVKKAGFVDVHHTVEVHGTCSDCAQQNEVGARNGAARRAGDALSSSKGRK